MSLRRFFFLYLAVSSVCLPAATMGKRLARPFRSVTVVCSGLVLTTALSTNWYLTKGPEIDVFPTLEESRYLERSLLSYANFAHFAADVRSLAPYYARYLTALQSRQIGINLNSHSADGTQLKPYENVLSFLAEIYLRADPGNPALMLTVKNTERPDLEAKVRAQIEHLGERQGFTLPPVSFAWDPVNRDRSPTQIWAEVFLRQNDLSGDGESRLTRFLGDALVARTEVTLRYHLSKQGKSDREIDKQMNGRDFLRSYPAGYYHGPWFDRQTGDMADLLRSMTDGPLEGLRKGLTPSVRELRVRAIIDALTWARAKTEIVFQKFVPGSK